jgi:hypothetical protein
MKELMIEWKNYLSEIEGEEKRVSAKSVLAFPENLSASIAIAFLFSNFQETRLYRGASFKSAEKVFRSHFVGYPPRYQDITRASEKAWEEIQEIINIYGRVHQIIEDARKAEGFKPKNSFSDIMNLYRAILVTNDLNFNNYYRETRDGPFWKFKMKLDGALHGGYSIDGRYITKKEPEKIAVRPKSMDEIKQQTDKDRMVLDDIKNFGQKFLSLEPEYQLSIIKIIYDYDLSNYGISDLNMRQAKDIISAF